VSRPNKPLSAKTVGGHRLRCIAVANKRLGAVKAVKTIGTVAMKTSGTVVQTMGTVAMKTNDTVVQTIGTVAMKTNGSVVQTTATVTDDGDQAYSVSPSSPSRSSGEPPKHPPPNA
jgi:hypothetical protein